VDGGKKGGMKSGSLYGLLPMEDSFKEVVRKIGPYGKGKAPIEQKLGGEKDRCGHQIRRKRRSGSFCGQRRRRGGRDFVHKGKEKGGLYLTVPEGGRGSRGEVYRVQRKKCPRTTLIFTEEKMGGGFLV